jgi:short subunit dehydrogenase-like uncharacterized protein
MEFLSGYGLVREAKSQTPARETKAGGRYKFNGYVKSGRSKQRPYQIKTSSKGSLLLFLVDVFGLFV